MQAHACALSLQAAGQGGGWARAGAEAIAALVDLSAAEVRELLGAGDGAGAGRGGAGGGAPALAQRAARVLAGLDGALADGAGRAIVPVPARERVPAVLRGAVGPCCGCCMPKHGGAASLRAPHHAGRQGLSMACGRSGTRVGLASGSDSAAAACRRAR